MVKFIVGEASEKKMQLVSLSNNTFKRPISDMFGRVKKLIMDKVKASPFSHFKQKNQLICKLVCSVDGFRTLRLLR